MKNPFKNLSARSIRIIFTAAAAIALFITITYFLRMMVYDVTSNDQCAWRPIPEKIDCLLITDVVPGGVTDRAGIKNQDILLKIDGKSFKRNQAQEYINAHRQGEYATYLVERNGVQFQTQVEILKLFNATFLAQFLLGLGFLLVGYIVVMTKPLGSIQRMFGRYGILCMLFFGLPVTDFRLTNIPPWQFAVLLVAFSIAHIFAPPVFVKFFLHFPVRRKILSRKWLVPLLYSMSILLTLLLLLSEQLSMPTSVRYAVAFTPYSFYITGLFIFTVSYFKLVEVSKRKQLRQILVAVTVGILTFTYILIVYTVNPFIIFLNPLAALPALILIFVPFAFGYAIFHYRLMDIDLIIKKSLIYGTVTTSLAAIYLLLVFGIGSLLGAVLGHSDNSVLSVLALIIIAFVFDPVKRRVQESIDRIFYRERRNYQKALLEFSQELPRQMNLEQILSSMVNRISGTMHVDRVAVVLCGQKDECYFVNRNIPEEYCRFVEEHNGLIELLKRTKSPQSFALISDEPDSVAIGPADRDKIISSGVVLAVPMFIKEKLIGTINAGAKLSGKVYSQEDIDLLSTVASQAAIAIENARLHRFEIEKQKIEEELALARRIQQGLFPKSSPVIDGLDIAGISIPASIVGGDYFDYIRAGPKKLFVVIADVSGKGMSASLYMSKVQGMVQLAAQMYPSPRDILVHVNRQLYEGMERKSFITMIIALFDMEKKEVRICRAGHNKAIIQSNGEFKQLNAKGIGLGLERGPVFENELEEVHRPLVPGKIFLLYTDGLTETMNEKHLELGEESVLDIVRKISGRDAQGIQDSLIAAANEFRGSAEQHDDLTLVVVKTK